jgi:hypothetical protein
MFLDTYRICPDLIYIYLILINKHLRKYKVENQFFLCGACFGNFKYEICIFFKLSKLIYDFVCAG